MYQVGTKSRRRRQRRIRLAVALSLVVVLVLAGWLIMRALRPHTTLNQSKAVVTTVKATTTPLKSYDEAAFSIELPSDWKVAERATAPYNVYRWQGTSKSTNTTLLEIYVDTIPLNVAVNHVLAIEANGPQISAAGEVSDNCANFTKALTPTSGGTHGRWQGVDFLCDLNNSERNVVGTSSASGINSVTVTGPTNLTHKFFFSFTDHSLTSDYTPFTSALLSFRVK